MSHPPSRLFVLPAASPNLSNPFMKWTITPSLGDKVTVVAQLHFYLQSPHLEPLDRRSQQKPSLPWRGEKEDICRSSPVARQLALPRLSLLGQLQQLSRIGPWDKGKSDRQFLVPRQPCGFWPRTRGGRKPAVLPGSKQAGEIFSLSFRRRLKSAEQSK